MEPTGLAARRAAHTALMQITTEGRTLAEVIASGLLKPLPVDQRARAQRLTLDALRSLDRADRMLTPHLKKRPPAHVMNALRLATYELGTAQAAHGVVNAYVEIVARNKRTTGMKGLTNAVLRKIAVAGPDDWAQRPVPLAPAWLRQPLVAAYGRKTVLAMEAAHFAGAPLDLTARDNPSAVAAATGGTLLPGGTIRLKDYGQITGLPGYETGAWWVQDAAAALPVRLLGDIGGLRILDLCAAPGGKTLQLAAGGADVTAIDISDSRMQRLRANLTRTGLRAELVVADAVTFDRAGYDAILLDAPCSATGTIRRHPDLPYAKDGSDFGALIDQQAALIDHALTLLAPGGRLVFCTCSLLPDEGEVQVTEALQRHADLTVWPNSADGIDPGWITTEGGLRLRPDYWPDLGGMDGFYMAVLRKAG